MGGKGRRLLRGALRLGRDREQVPAPCSNPCGPSPLGSRHDPARPPASGRPLLRRRHRQRVAGHSGPPAPGRVRVGHLRGEGTPAHGPPRPPALGVRGRFRAGDGLPLPLLDRQRRRAAHPHGSRPPGGDLPQHHARPLLPGLSPPPRGALLSRPARAFGVRRPRRARPRRQRVQPPRARGGRVPRAPGCCPIVLDFGAYDAPPSPVTAAALRGRPHQPPLRRAHHPQQEDRRPDPGLRRLPALRSTRAAGFSWSATTAGTSATSTASRRWCESCGSTRWCSPGTSTTTTSWPATRSPTSSCASPSTRASASRCMEAMHFGLPGGRLRRRRGERRPCAAAACCSARSGPRSWPSWSARILTDEPPARRGPGHPGARARRRSAAPTSARCFGSGSRRFSTEGPALRIDQWVPALHRGDAIGDSARLMRDAFRRWGHEADVYALELDADLEGDGRPWSEWHAGGPDDVVIFHYALPSPLTAAFREHRGRRVLLHHNITPPEFFVDLGPGDGPHLRPRAAGAVAAWPATPTSASRDSECNRQELEALGFRRTGVLPIYLDFAPLPRAAEPRPAARCSRTGARTCSSSGRLAPNKRQEDLIRVAVLLEALHLARRPARPRGQASPPARLLRRAAVLRLRARGSRPRRSCSSATSTTTTCWPATPPPTSSSP